MTPEQIKQAKQDELKWEALTMFVGFVSLWLAFKRYQTKKKQIG
jgi:hypothetical protein